MFYKFLYLGFNIYCFLFRPIRMGVRVMMIEKDKVWLVRHTYLSGWYMPGGGIKKWESLDQAARREAHEETGAELGNISLVGVFTNSGRPIIPLSFFVMISSSSASLMRRSRKCGCSP